MDEPKRKAIVNGIFYPCMLVIRQSFLRYNKKKKIVYRTDNHDNNNNNNNSDWLEMRSLSFGFIFLFLFQKCHIVFSTNLLKINRVSLLNHFLCTQHARCDMNGITCTLYVVSCLLINETSTSTIVDSL